MAHRRRSVVVALPGRRTKPATIHTSSLCGTMPESAERSNRLHSYATSSVVFDACILLTRLPAPSAPTTDQATYQSCFCQSGYLPALKTNDPSGVCPNCSAGDSDTIAKWYQGACGTANGPPPAATTLVTVTAGGAPPAATTTRPSGATTGSDGTGIAIPDGQTWYVPSFPLQSCWLHRSACPRT